MKVPRALLGLYNNPNNNKNKKFKIPIPPQLPPSSKTKTKTKTKTKHKKPKDFAKWGFTNEYKKILPKKWTKVSNNNIIRGILSYKSNKRKIPRVMTPLNTNVANKAAINIMKNNTRAPRPGNGRLAELPYPMDLSYKLTKKYPQVNPNLLKKVKTNLSLRQPPKYTKKK